MPTSWSSADLLLPKGWSVVALGFVTLAFAFTVRGSLSLAMPLWQAEFGWSRSAISSIAAAALLVMAAVAPFAGYIADRRGPRALLGAGLIAIGLGLTFVVFAPPDVLTWLLPRSEERRVGKEGVRPCRYRWSPDK